jgi:hypothetical protein
MKAWKDQSKDETDDFEERAAIGEFDGGLTRDAAEAQALKILLDNRLKAQKETK